MAQLTTKLRPRNTGLYSVGHPFPGMEIKLSGKVVGFVQPISALKDSYEIWLRIKDEDSPCGWSNHKLKFSARTAEEVRAWIKEHSEALQQKYSLVPQ